jgi:epoxyqueuosine reductase
MKSYTLAERSAWIKREAQSMGFSFVGISKAEFLEEEAPRLEQWLKEEKHGKMDYMANHFDKRLDPRLLVPGAKSVVSLMYNYFTQEVQTDEAPRISKYAYGEDYHEVIKAKLREFWEKMESHFGQVEGRIFVDSAPVLEKAWAKKSGIGWVGKNTNLISKQQGSFFFLSELIIDLELQADGPIKDYCGTCTACIDACPTDAIVAPYEVDGSKCISYFTIELKEALPNDVKGKMDNWMFGCDVCQDVCPWNRFSKPHNEPLFHPKSQLLTMSREEWRDLTEEVFKELFRRSPVKRTKYEGLKRNIFFLD